MAFTSRARIKAAAWFAGIILVSLVLALLVAPVIIPLLLSSALYILLEPVVSFLQRKGASRQGAIAIVLVVLLGSAGGLLSLAMPALSGQLRHLGERLPGAWEDFAIQIEQAEKGVAASLGFSHEESVILRGIREVTERSAVQSVGVLTRWGSRVALWAVLVPLISFFLLRDYRSLRNMLIGLMPNRYFERTLTIYHRVTHQLMTYIRGVLIQSGVIALVTGTGFLIIGLPTAPVLGLLAGILNVIPYVGPMLGLVAPSFVALATGMGLDTYAGILLVVLVAQLIDNIFVIPTVVAQAANIHPLVALLGVIIAGNFFGFMGMVFAIPVLSSGRIVYSGLFSGVERRAHG